METECYMVNVGGNDRKKKEKKKKNAIRTKFRHKNADNKTRKKKGRVKLKWRVMKKERREANICRGHVCTPPRLIRHNWNWTKYIFLQINQTRLKRLVLHVSRGSRVGRCKSHRCHRYGGCEHLNPAANHGCTQGYTRHMLTADELGRYGCRTGARCFLKCAVTDSVSFIESWRNAAK